MKLSAQLLLRPSTPVKERYTSEQSIASLFKGLFVKPKATVHEESFSAPDMIGRLHAALNSSGITNLVRLSHDETEFYLDQANKPHDLASAIDDFKLELQSAFERFYEEISVIMEANFDEIDYLIELNLMRVHPIGQYPIQISFSGIPQNAKVSNAEKSFNLFINSVEQNLSKYIDLQDTTISFSKNYSSPHEDESNNDEKEDKKADYSKCNFFPLYGITLGETSVKELAKKGTKAKDFDSDKKPYKYYRVKDMRFWHNGHTATHMYLTYTDPLPKQWRKCGFSWKLSYNSWIKKLEKLGFFVSVVDGPEKEWYRGKRTLVANVHAIKSIKEGLQAIFEFDFNYSQKTSTNAEGTLYSIRVRVD